MNRNPRVIVAALAHGVVTATLLYSIAVAALPLVLRIIVATAVAAALLPALHALLNERTERFTAVALLLVLVIGAGLVEVFATGGAVHAIIILGAAMLEFALLFTLTRRRPR